MSEQRCENCRFFGELEPDEDGSDCLRYAPREFRKDGSQTALWPFVFRTEWCGEWQNHSPDKPIESLDGFDCLSVRAKNILYNARIFTFDELSRQRRDGFSQLRNCGATAEAELCEFCSKNDIKPH